MTAPPTSPIIGIDLGTTMSAVAVFEDERPRILENDLGDLLTPSVVARDPRSGGLAVGRIARDLLAHKPHLAAAQFKRDMGAERAWSLGNQEFSPIELSACVLDALRGDAERLLGVAIRRCVVTVPAYFNEAQRFATKRAAEIAGLFVERVLNEPTAAAIAHGLHKSDDESRFLVFDLGGGTFDVCVMELFEGMLEVKSVAGESRLGGEDFTRVLALLAAQRAGHDPAAIERDGELWATLYKRAELLKRQLSRWPEGSITVPEMGAIGEQQLTVTGAEARAAWGPLLDRMIGPCRAALRGAGLRATDLDEVLLVGGATRMPCISELATSIFGRAPLVSDDPDLLVVRGAAVQAALCADDEGVSDLVVTDVASHSLGVSVAKDRGAYATDGYFAPVIHRNTVIPISQAIPLRTMSPNQRRVHVQVFEGEGRRVEDNRHIGDFWVDDLPMAPAGAVEIEVTFTLDLDGILEVEAEVVATGAKTSKLFTRTGSRPDGARLERARERIRALKTSPELRPRYRDLLGRAELLWRELTGEPREILDFAIHAFEGALQRRAQEAIDAAYEQLRQVCEGFDKGERW